MIARALSIIAAASLLSVSFAAGAAEGPSYALRAGRIMPVAPDQPWIIEDGVIIVRDGRIEAIGRDLEIPSDFPVLDYRDATIVPGFVAASTDLAGSHNGEESVSGAYHAADAFDRYGDYRELLGAGITTAHLNPGWHRLVSGRGAVVRLGGLHDERVLANSADLTITLAETAHDPPELIELLIPPSGDQPMPTPVLQRPSSRMGQLLALREVFTGDGTADDNAHLTSARQAWSDNLPLRIHAQRGPDVAAACSFLAGGSRNGYVVGGIQALDAVNALRESGTPLVYTVNLPLRSTSWNIGGESNALESDVTDLSNLEGVRVALATAPGLPLTDLRLTAAMACRGGLSEEAALEAITRNPAEILGLGDRIGSLKPGADADFLVLNGPPLATATDVQRSYVRGQLVFDRAQAQKPSNALVVKAGTVWAGPDRVIENGSVLIEDGRVTAVGLRVPQPANARVIDAGADAWITPGFIDAHGHLGLAGDRSSLQPQLTPTRLIGAADDASLRVARSGVTTVAMSPYQFDGNGSQIGAIKTAGDARDERVIRPTTAVAFDIRGMDPPTIPQRFNNRIEAAKKYIEKWEQYEKDFEEWKRKRDAGELVVPAEPESEETVTETRVEDPITGTWSGRVFGGPLPQEVSGKVAFRLNGNNVEGRVVEPAAPMEHRIVGTLSDKRITGTIEVDTGGMGVPTWEGELVEADLMRGTVSIQSFVVNFEMRRTDKSGVEFRVTRQRRQTTGKDGRPLPPPVDESLEPMRAVLEKRIPIVVRVSTPQEIDAVLDLLVDQHELHVALLGAEEARIHTPRLIEKSVAVILPSAIVRSDRESTYHQGDDLSRQGVVVAFESDSEDGARLLPLVGLYAVEQGMSADAVLEAVTSGAAKLLRIDDRVGTLEPGKDGDLVIFSGHPFEAASAVKRVFVNGQEVQQ